MHSWFFNASICTEKNLDVGIAKRVRYNEQLIFAVKLNARISHMNCLHK